MDGFAVDAKETANATESHPVTLRFFDRVNTGNVVRPSFNAVIKIEDVIFDGTDSPREIRISAPISAGVNVRPVGEDILKNQLILPAGAKIRALDVGAIAGYGITSVYVKTVSIGIIPTGSELIAPGSEPKPGQVVESNTIMAEAYLRGFGVSVIRYPPVEDNRVLIQGALERALAENEVVLISAGSSMGSRDYTSSVISEIGELVFHGVFMKPAKPSMLGIVNKKPVIGMPGFPLSAQTSLRLFVRELLEAWGWEGPETSTVVATAGDTISSDAALDEFSFAAVGRVGGRYVALPQMRASSVQMNGIRANANLHIPRGTAGFAAGESVLATLNVPPEEVERTILIGGVYGAGAQRVSAAAAGFGISVRFGDLNAVSGLRQLVRRACHGACVPEGATLFPVLEGVAFERVPLGDGTMMVIRTDMMGDPMVSTLSVLAKKAGRV